MPVPPSSARQPIPRCAGRTPSSRALRALVWLAAWLLSCVLAEGLDLGEGVFAWVEQRYGPAARERVVGLDRLVKQHAAASEASKLERVNDFFNAVPYDSDQGLWQQEDYWATPVEMLGVHGADCEDYAIAKYFTLRELGVPAERLRITYVKALTLNQAHMVLAYYPRPDDEPLILDNLNARIQPAGERDDLVPVYSFNGEDLWLSVNRARGKKVGGSDRIKLWNKLRAKMAQQGQP